MADPTPDPASEKRQAFLLALSDDFRANPDERAIGRTCVTALARHMGVDRCYITQMSDELNRGLVGPEHLTPGLRSISGEHSFDGYPDAVSRFRSGVPFISSDVANDPALSDLDKSSIGDGLGLQAILSVHLYQGEGRSIWALTVGTVAPRDWAREDIHLVQEVAERTWAAVERAKAEAALRAARERTEADLAAMTRLHEIGTLCAAPHAEEAACLAAILDAAIEMTGAARGNLQLFDAAGGVLRIAVQRGFERPFLDHFDTVAADHPAACGRAFSAARRVLVPDVTRSDLFAGTPTLKILLDAQVRAVQSTPLVSSTGRVLGMVSTHFPRPHTPDDQSLRLIDLLARQAGDFLERRHADAALRASEEKYRTLFETMNQGYALCRLTRDDDGRAIDFVYQEINPAFHTLTGLDPAAVLGHRLSEIIPGVDPFWLTTYARVVETGQPARFERELPELGRVFDVTAYPQGGDRFVALFDDITARKRAERAIQASEERQAFLLKLSDALRAEPDADAVADRAIRMLFEQMRLDRCYITFYRPTDDEADFPYQVGNDTVPPLPAKVRLSDFPEAYEQVLERTFVIDDDFERRGLSEAERANSKALGMRAMLASTVRRGEKNPLCSMVAVSSRPRHWSAAEIALVEETAERTWAAIERARAEAALRASEGRFRTMADTAPATIWTADPTGAITFHNRRWLEYTGIDPADNVTDWPRLVLHPDDFDRCVSAWGYALATGGEYQIEVRNRRADGVYRWFLTRATPVRGADGRIVEWFGSTIDIDDRKAAEEAARRSEERLRLALAAARMGIWTLDPDTGTHARDANLNALLGLAAADTTQPFAEFLGHLHPADRAGVAAAFDRSARDHQPLNIEFRVVRPDGAERWLRDQGDVFHTAGSRLLAGACVDITDLKQAEAALQAANDRLEGRVAERTAELEHEIDRRRELSRRLGTAQEDERRRVARELHDSVGQLLAALGLSVKAARDAAPLPPPTADRLDEVQRVADELGKATHDLAVRLRPTALDDLGLAAALRQYLNEWFSRTGVAVEYDAAAVEAERLPPEVETAFYRIVQEAVTNVTRHAHATRVGVVVGRRDGLATLTVEDDGGGFDPDEAAKGKRLGIVGMRERVALLGGELHIESDERGTTVFARVPLTGG